MEICQVMKLIYKAKWATVILFAITFVASFAVLFVGGTACQQVSVGSRYIADNSTVGKCDLCAQK